MTRSITGLLVAASMVGCTADRTEILVTVDSDLSVPDEIDRIAVETTPPRDPAVTSEAPLGTGEAPLPRVLGLVWEDGPLGPFVVRAFATLRGGAPVVERSASVSFVEGKTLHLRLDLLGDCRGVTCGDGQTCVAGTCVSRDIEELPPWRGRPSPLGDTGVDGGPPTDAGRDAGTDAGRDAGVDACMPSGAETCNGRDDDCNGTIDDGFDLRTDLANCGACGAVCDLANGTEACVGGTCRIEDCDMGFENCDGANANGCEADLASDSTCGTCSNTCRGMDSCCMSTTCQRTCP